MNQQLYSITDDIRRYLYISQRVPIDLKRVCALAPVFDQDKGKTLCSSCSQDSYQWSISYLPMIKNLGWMMVFFPLTIPCSQKRFVLDINVLLIISMSRLKHLLEIPALSTVNRLISWMTQPPFLSFSLRHAGWIADQKKIKSRLKSKITTPSIWWQLSILDLKAYSSLAEFCSSGRAVSMCYCHCVVEAQFVNSNCFPSMLEV